VLSGTAKFTGRLAIANPFSVYQPAVIVDKGPRTGVGEWREQDAEASSPGTTLLPDRQSNERD